MARQDPKQTRYVPGNEPVPEEQQIQERPFDSADWMNREPQGYPEPLFPDGGDVQVFGPDAGDQEAKDG